MLFAVEREHEGIWRVVDLAVEAVTHRQAVARACTVPGLYRARHLDEPGREPRHFWVPVWGAPEPLRLPG